jgi:hypothetical protein
MRRELKFCLATLVGTIVYLLIGWFVFEFLLGSYMEANTTQVSGFTRGNGETIVSMMILSCFAYAALISFIFTYVSPVVSLTRSFIVSAIVGILVAMMTDFYWYSTCHFFNGLTPIAVDVLAAGVTVGVMGSSINFILRHKESGSKQ